MKFDKRIYRWQFLSTLSLRRATQFTGPQSGQDLISIHALLAESDLGATWAGHINTGFLSTLSLRRATKRQFFGNRYLHNFYPRSPCGERRLCPLIHNDAAVHFYPRSPCGERPFNAAQPAAQRNFYPRSPCGERQFLAVSRLLR